MRDGEERREWMAKAGPWSAGNGPGEKRRKGPCLLWRNLPAAHSTQATVYGIHFVLADWAVLVPALGPGLWRGAFPMAAPESSDVLLCRGLFIFVHLDRISWECERERDMQTQCCQRMQARFLTCRRRASLGK